MMRKKNKPAPAGTEERRLQIEDELKALRQDLHDITDPLQHTAKTNELVALLKERETYYDD